MSALKVVQGSFHQGNKKFGDTAGKQCTCCSLFSVAFTLIKSPGYWDSKDLDFILENGDYIYKSLNRSDYLMFSDLPIDIPLSININIYQSIVQSHVQVEFKENKFGIINRGQHVPGLLLEKQVSSKLDLSRLLLLIKSVCVSIVWTKRNLFLFDSHSTNKKGECYPDGFSTIMTFNCKSALEIYITKNYLTEDDGNTQFEIQYIMVSNMNKQYNLSNDCKAFKEKKRKVSENEKLKCRERNSTDTQKAKCKKRKATCIEKEKTKKRVANYKAKEKCKVRLKSNCCIQNSN